MLQRDPAHVGAEDVERLDQHGGLHRHVQAAHDARAGQRRLALVARAQRHQAGHLLLGEAELVAAELGEPEVGDLVRQLVRPRLRVERVGVGCDSHRVPSVVEHRQEARGRTAVATNIAGPRAPGSTPASCQRSPARPASANAASTVGAVEAEPDVAHRAAVVVVGVREHVGHDEPTARAQHARDLGERGGRIGHVVEEVHDEREVERCRARAAAPRCGPARSARCRSPRAARGRPRASRARSRRPRPSARRARSSRRCGPSRSRGRRRPPRGRAGRAAAAGRSSRRTARRARGPTRRRRRRRTTPCRAAAAVQHLLAPAPVEAHGDRLGEALVDDRPEPLRALVELVDREHVAAARAVAPRRDPARVGEQLEVPRDRRLRQRERVAELDDGQLDLVEAGEHAPARAVGEQAELAEERRRRVDRGEAGCSFHPSIRIIENPCLEFKFEPSPEAAAGPRRRATPARRRAAATRRARRLRRGSGRTRSP